MTGSTSLSACLPAPRGNYAAGEGNDGFTPCEPGTYQDQQGGAVCKVLGRMVGARKGTRAGVAGEPCPSSTAVGMPGRQAGRVG